MYQNINDSWEPENLDIIEDAAWGALSLREDHAEHELERLGAWG